MPSKMEITRRKDAKRVLCAGCRDNYYNGNNPHGVSECWRLKSARKVTRYRIGWWTQPTSAEAFKKVTTLHCHSAPGRYAHFERLPDHLIRITKRSTTKQRSEAET